MIQRLFQHLTNRRKIELRILGAAIFLIFLLLVFTPYIFLDWVNAHRTIIMWMEMGLQVIAFFVLLFEIDDLNKTISKWQMNEMSEQKEQQDMYKIYDEKGDLKLIVRPEMLYYIESADNYVIIHYLNSDKMEKMMIRNTLKNIEWRFRDKTLVRCHRSYIVNIANVKMLKRADNELLLDFGIESLRPLPVSKTYSNEVMQRLSV